MKIVRDDLWLCSDCLHLAVNGDASSLDYYYGDKADDRLAEIEAGLAKLGPHLVPNFDSEIGEGEEIELGAYVTRQPCACCKTRLHGSRYRFAILGPS